VIGVTVTRSGGPAPSSHQMDDGDEYLGRGSAATGGGPRLDDETDLYARCIGCGDSMSLNLTSTASVGAGTAQRLARRQVSGRASQTPRSRSTATVRAWL
jgi:hypothetical protein